MDFSILQYGDAGWGDEMLRGAIMTMAIAVSSYSVALLFGVVFAAFKLSNFIILKVVSNTYTTIFRGVPELLVIYLVFFGGEMLLHKITSALFGYNGSISMPIFVTGMLCIGLGAGAFCTEVIRGAILAVPPGQREGADALGLSKWSTSWDVLFPQALRIALPGLANVWQITLKDTALISVIGLVEIMRSATLATGATRHPFTFYLIAALLFLVITSITNRGFKKAETWSNKGVEY
jgi:octopine/nopaline transport system permease protein